MIKRPQPKYGWYGQTANPCTELVEEDIAIGSRVCHQDEPFIHGTVVGGPVVLVIGGPPCWVVEWDKFPGVKYKHACDTLQKLK